MRRTLCLVSALFVTVVLFGCAREEPKPAFVSWQGEVEISDAMLTYIHSNADIVPHPNETWMVKLRWSMGSLQQVPFTAGVRSQGERWAALPAQRHTSSGFR